MLMPDTVTMLLLLKCKRQSGQYYLFACLLSETRPAEQIERRRLDILKSVLTQAGPNSSTGETWWATGLRLAGTDSSLRQT